MNNLAKSAEYLKVALNPFNPIEKLQIALDDFRKRTFLENLPTHLRIEFEASSFYKAYTQNPFHSVEDLHLAYQSFEFDQHNDYLVKLKERIGDQNFEEFTNSDAYRNPNPPNTLEGIQAAYHEFQNGKSF